MAYIDRNEPKEYPYTGTFSRLVADTTKPLDERDDEPTVILTTECDIMESSHMRSGIFATADYAVFFPVPKSETVTIQRGDEFNADFNGVNVSGKVMGVFPSQLDGCTAYIQVVDA